MIEYTREMLIEICEKAIVPVKLWRNRDTPQAQLGVYKCLGLLKAGCNFQVSYPRHPRDIGGCITDGRAIWLHIFHPSFGTFDHSGPGDEVRHYLPTLARLEQADGGDWY